MLATHQNFLQLDQAQALIVWFDNNNITWLDLFCKDGADFDFKKITTAQKAKMVTITTTNGMDTTNLRHVLLAH